MKKLRVLVAFNTLTPFSPDKDYTDELKLPDWRTEASVVSALKELEFPFELLGV